MLAHALSSPVGRAALGVTLAVCIIGGQIALVNLAARKQAEMVPAEEAPVARQVRGGFRSLAAEEETGVCPNFDGAPPKKALPSLMTCQMFTEKTCCVAGHDQDVQTQIEKFLPSPCTSNFDVFTEYMCMGCSPDIDKYVTYYNAGKPADADVTEGKLTDSAKIQQTTTVLKAKLGKIGEIRLCESFARNLFYDVGEDGNQVSDSINAYDGCAFGDVSNSKHMLSSMLFALEDADYVDATATPLVAKPYSAGDDSVILRSPYHKFFDSVRPSGYPVSEYEVSWYHTTDCYGAASTVQLGSMAVALVALLASMLA